MSGCSRFSSQAFSSGWENIIVRIAARSNVPSDLIIFCPKRSAMNLRAGMPGSTIFLDALSASTTSIPRSIKALATVLLPLPIPPVNPTIYGFVDTVIDSI